MSKFDKPAPTWSIALMAVVALGGVLYVLFNTIGSNLFAPRNAAADKEPDAPLTPVAPNVLASMSVAVPKAVLPGTPEPKILKDSVARETITANSAQTGIV